MKFIHVAGGTPLFSMRQMLWGIAGMLTAFVFFGVLNSNLPQFAKADMRSNVVSPELYNSALAPAGEEGGKIIPASCSIGQLSDGADGWVPCPNPSVSICVDGSCATSPRTTSVVGGQNKSWSYTAANAFACNFSTTMSPSTAGPSFTILDGPVSAGYNPGPFGNVNGYVRYTLTCRNVDGSQIGSNNITINTSISPKVNLQFGGSQSPFLNIDSFTGPGTVYSGGGLSWKVTGASSCTATGPSGWSGSTISLPTGSKNVSYTGTYPTIRHYTLTCTNGTDTVSKTVSIEFEGSGALCGGTTGKICY
jgi:hypothetical protein